MIAGTYTVTVDCGNCRAPNILDIPVGVRVRHFCGYPENPKKCQTCGVAALEPDTAEAVLPS